MLAKPMSELVEQRLQSAAQKLGTADPTQFVKPLLDRTFRLPQGHERYADNSLTPGAAPCEPSFSELEPDSLRFNLEPLGPDASPVSRRLEATREMRRLVGPVFGNEALRWFDCRSEAWRGMGPRSRLGYGAYFGTSYDRDGLQTSKVYYEMSPQQIDALPPMLATLVRYALETTPALLPLFTSIACRRTSGSQRATFLYRGTLRLTDLGALMQRLGMGRQLPSMMQIIGVALGGRFELPEQSVLLSLGQTSQGPELELYVLLGMIPDLPDSFLSLLSMGLAERPRELTAMHNWLRAFTPDSQSWPGNFSVLSVHVTGDQPARVSLYLRPIEFEINRQSQTTP